MATVDVLSAVSIVGLQRAPTAEDLEASRKVYNTLLHPEDQPDVTERTLKDLGELFVRHKVQDVFGIHLLHGHFMAPEGTVLVGTHFNLPTNSNACWTKPVPIAGLKMDTLQGHVFTLQSDGSFIPYEYHEGAPDAKAASTSPAFFQEFADFLQKQNLASLIALQLLDGTEKNTNMEFMTGPQSTVMLDERDVIGFDQPRISTGWSFRVGDDGIISCKGNDVYAPKTNSSHQVFQDSKPLTISTVEELKDALRKEAIIA